MLLIQGLATHCSSLRRPPWSKTQRHSFHSAPCCASIGLGWLICQEKRTSPFPSAPTPHHPYPGQVRPSCSLPSLFGTFSHIPPLFLKGLSASKVWGQSCRMPPSGSELLFWQLLFLSPAPSSYPGSQCSNYFWMKEGSVPCLLNSFRSLASNFH